MIFTCLHCRLPDRRQCIPLMGMGRKWSHSGIGGNDTIRLQVRVIAYIQEALVKADGVIRGEHGAAALLGIPESTLRYRIKKLGLGSRESLAAANRRVVVRTFDATRVSSHIEQRQERRVLPATPCPMARMLPALQSVRSK